MRNCLVGRRENYIQGAEVGTSMTWGGIAQRRRHLKINIYNVRSKYLHMRIEHHGAHLGVEART
jgi:hypothetical protein